MTNDENDIREGVREGFDFMFFLLLVVAVSETTCGEADTIVGYTNLHGVPARRDRSPRITCSSAK